MTNQPDLWNVRKLDDSLDLELHVSDIPDLSLIRGENRVRVGLYNIKGLVAALADAAAHLAEVLAAGGVYHA